MTAAELTDLEKSRLLSQSYAQRAQALTAELHRANARSTALEAFLQAEQSRAAREAHECLVRENRLSAELQTARGRIADLEASLSWSLTAPLRGAAKLLGRR